MHIIEHLIISIISLCIFVLGIITHKYCLSNTGISYNLNTKNLDRNILNKHSGVIMDETKVVLKIDTNNLEKKADLVGDTTVSQNDTASAINKLKGIKKGK